MAFVNAAETESPSLAKPPARQDGPAVPAKSKNHNIRISPAVLDAAGKDGEELLHSLRPTTGGLTQTEAEERARTGPIEVARRGWSRADAPAAKLKAMIHVTTTVIRDGAGQLAQPYWQTGSCRNEDRCRARVLVSSA
jgi:hypothetical protein